VNSSQQLGILDKTKVDQHFAEKLKISNQYPLKATKIDIFQINISKRCNLNCKHCHVEAGPTRKEMMSKSNLKRSLEILSDSPSIGTIDITGGSPEMNPHLEWFIRQASKLGKRHIVRSNLVILLEKEYSKFIDVYAEEGIEIVGSLPDYRAEKTNRQRGERTYEKCIEILQLLNKKGYGREGTGLILDLVHNPAGAYLPGAQEILESEYRMQLKDEYDITFNNLFCLANMPIGRYLDYLLKTDNYDDYLQELYTSYNPSTLNSVMCKTTISIGYDGRLYDCDFNQMLDLTISDPEIQHINNFDLERLGKREIVIRNHCYGCTAGSGSSCQGCLK